MGSVSVVGVLTDTLEKSKVFAPLSVDMCEETYGIGSTPGNSYLGMRIAL